MQDDTTIAHMKHSIAMKRFTYSPSKDTLLNIFRYVLTRASAVFVLTQLMPVSYFTPLWALPNVRFSNRAFRSSSKFWFCEGPHPCLGHASLRSLIGSSCWSRCIHGV